MVNDIILSRFKDDPPASLSDGERRIYTGPLYPPEEVIALLSDSAEIRPSTEDCFKDIQCLELDNEDLAELLDKAVKTGRYRKSIWCQLKGRTIAACDDYVVTEKTWIEAVHKEMECEIYLK
jgi:hypothetical protein